MKTKHTSLVAAWVAAFALWFAIPPAGGQPFVNSGVPIPIGVGYQGSAVWGDYDNDGRLDVLITGQTEGIPRSIAQVWRNTGSAFVDINAGLPENYYGSAAWGDYDNDGRLDILMAGYTGSNYVAGVWRNTGSGFTNVPIPGLVGTLTGTVAWGDYDNDGRLDFLLTGWTGSSHVSQVWRNTGSAFTNINAGLTGVSGPAAWGDYDNDGRLDILLTGVTNSFGTRVSQLWRNTGTGFTHVPIPGLPEAQEGSVAWGDYDNDGRLDFLLTGWDNHVNHYCQVWRNTGNTFTNVPIPGLPGIRDGSAAWGDYDNDGRLDILLAGYPGPITQVWRNTGDTFTNVPVPGLQGIGQCSVAWGDYNNDGRLDILIAGNNASNLRITQIWRNTAAVANTPPPAPSGLIATALNRGAMLSWNAPADAQTPASGLSYNVRVGTAPGSWNILSPQGWPATNYLRVAALGNAQQGLTALI
ncbi:MAG TPA: VCBS repeat-containing protein, partial [Verrucomicrobiae bacterium]|nr:VCBS repeat-containing protein [Verrucomicrobiae bacterium]